jgi:hypothetical protein
MLTSVVRHHTVLLRPVIGHVQGGEILDQSQLDADFGQFLDQTTRVTTGRLAVCLDDNPSFSKYNPVGYVLSLKKDEEDERLSHRAEAVKGRENRTREDALSRLSPVHLEVGA